LQVNNDEFTVDIDTASEVDCLQAQVVDLTERLTKLQLKYEKPLFRLENIRDDDESVHFHTGFPNYETLLAFYKDVLEEDAKVMRQ